MSPPVDVSVTIPDPFAETTALIVSVPLAVRPIGPFTEFVVTLAVVVKVPV